MVTTDRRKFDFFSLNQFFQWLPKNTYFKSVAVKVLWISWKTNFRWNVPLNVFIFNSPCSLISKCFNLFFYRNISIRIHVETDVVVLHVHSTFRFWLTKQNHDPWTSYHIAYCHAFLHRIPHHSPLIMPFFPIRQIIHIILWFSISPLILRQRHYQEKKTFEKYVQRTMFGLKLCTALKNDCIWFRHSNT